MSNEKKKEYLLKIGMTARLGCFTWEKRSRLVVGAAIYIFGLIIILGGIIIVYFLLENPSINDFLVILLSIIFIFIIGLLPLLSIFFIFSNRKKKILIWLEDAIEGEGITKIIDKRKWMLGSSLIKLKIDFIINGVKYERYTGDANVSIYYNFHAKDGYYSGIDQYADKQVKVLYSPKYDEVMILRN